MTQDQIIILAILAATVAMFVWGRWRHDMVALAALLACVVAELVPAEQAFAGFGHPAVITVACVLVLSRSLQTSGAVDAFTQRMLPKSTGPMLTIAALAAVAAVLSAFMNNVGALALLMPVALQIAARHELPPGKVLMPLAFGSILGGMTTLIGTPTNLIVSGFRAQTGAGSFTMFDFTPVGIAIAGVGIVFLGLLGPRLVPARERAGTESFETGSYLTEARIPENSKTAGKTLREIEAILDEVDAQVVGLIRHEVRMLAPYPAQAVRAGDILIIVADPEGLTTALANLDLKLEEAVHEAPPPAEDLKPDNTGETATAAAEADSEKPKSIEASEIVLMEFAVLPDSNLNGRSATDTRLRTQFGVNLLAVSRQGRRSITRLRSMELHAGDVLLMQGAPEALSEFAAQYGCVPLAERELRIPDKRRALTATGIMLVAVSGAAFGLVPAAIAFAAGVLASMALRLVPPRTVYDAIDWPVIVLLGAMIPVAGAIASTGAADLIARLLLTHLAQGHAIVGLALILVVTMTLSDFMNNAATAAVMCPIAIGTAERLGASTDPFLMAVAIGASCAFLTPIGHQNNTLILGPGGFQFGDYWRLGLPLELLVLAVSIPMLLWVWPL
jgi:di/tricarboxylate transporter